jgi:hypothetical protein
MSAITRRVGEAKQRMLNELCLNTVYHRENKIQLTRGRPYEEGAMRT